VGLQEAELTMMRMARGHANGARCAGVAAVMRCQEVSAQHVNSILRSRSRIDTESVDGTRFGPSSAAGIHQCGHHLGP